MKVISVKIVENGEEITSAKEVRRQVFQLEQGIDEKTDFDGKDEKADHIIACFNDKVVGTIRIRYTESKIAKLERLAVLKEHRKIGVGKKILEYVINYLKEKGIKSLTLDSQYHAKGFYEKFGFEEEGESFEEAGIKHIKMVKIF